MSRKHPPRSAWSFPAVRFPFSALDESEEESWLKDFSDPSGLSVSEDDHHVYVEAALPGVSAQEIEMTFDKGILWIKAEKRELEEDKRKKYYRKATSSFSYRVAIPGEVSEQSEPEATFKNGMLKVTFPKTTKKESKRIPIKEE